MHPVVFVMPGKAGAAGHERVVAVANGDVGDIAQVRGRAGCRLLRHPDGLIPADKGELGAVDVMGLDQDAIPGRCTGTGSQGGTGRVVRGCHSVNQITVTLAKPSAIPAVLSDDLKIDMLAEIELTHETFAMERLVADGSARKNGRTPVLGNPRGRSLADHGIEAETLDTSFAGVESLAGGKKSGISIAIRELGRAIVRAQKGGGISGAIIPGMAH